MAAPEAGFSGAQQNPLIVKVQRGGDRGMQGGGGGMRSSGGGGGRGVRSGGGMRSFSGGGGSMRSFRAETGPRRSVRGTTVQRFDGMRGPRRSFSYRDGARVRIDRGRHVRGPRVVIRDGRRVRSPRVVIRDGRRFGFSAGCEWMRRQALATGSAYWWQRYRNCVL